MIVVTGAGGFVGGRLVLALAGAGTRVRALVRHHRPWLDAPGIEQVVGDLTALDGADAVVHLAAPNEVEAGADPAGSTASAVEAAHRVASAAVRHGVGRMVLASTVHVYGRRAVPGARLDEQLRCEPDHPYAVARLAAEHLCATALDRTETDLVVLRLCNAVGAPADPRVDRWTLLVNDLVRGAVEGGELVLRSTGQQWRDFVPLADACVGFIAATDPTVLPAGTYNLGSGRSRTVRQVAGMVADAVEARTGRRPPLHAPPALGDDPDPVQVDVSRLRAHGVLVEPGPLEAAIDEVVDLVVEHAT